MLKVSLPSNFHNSLPITLPLGSTWERKFVVPNHAPLPSGLAVWMPNGRNAERWFRQYRAECRMQNGRNAEWCFILLLVILHKWVFKYLVVRWLCTCFWHKQTRQTLMQNWPEGVEHSSHSKVFRSTALLIKLRVKLFQLCYMDVRVGP